MSHRSLLKALCLVTGQRSPQRLILQNCKSSLRSQSAVRGSGTPATKYPAVWIALSDMSEDMGLLKFVPGSHGDIHPVEINRTPEHNNPNRLRIADLEHKSSKWEGEAISAGPMNAGDVILFNSLLVHRSGHNQSQKYKWVANGRYARADDAQFIARDYHTARLKYPYYFETAHPDLVVS